MVAINFPPPPLGTIPRPEWLTVRAGEQLFRVFDPNSFKTGALTFRNFGPLSRFDHHHMPVQEDRGRGILYAGRSISCCIVEVFGDTRVISVGNFLLAHLEVTRDLLFLELRGAGAMKAGTIAGVCKDSNRKFSQAWSRYFYENSSFYKNVDGLIFANAHNDEDSFALYERAADGLSEIASTRLSSKTLESEVLLTAAENTLRIETYSLTP